MDYLLEEVLDAMNAPFSDKHKFVRDRTRAIRQDIIVQQRAIKANSEWTLHVVRLHEEIARFHILSGHCLCELGFSEFDPFQNTEQLRKVLQSLQEYYTDIRSELSSASGPRDSFLMESLANEAEFRAYLLLTHAEDQEVFRRALAFPPAVFHTAQVQFAMSCVSAFHQADYVRYFRMIVAADYLQACLMHTHFTKLRSKALEIMSRAFSSKDGLPAADVARWLSIETMEELAEFVDKFGGKIDSNAGTIIYLVPSDDVIASPTVNGSSLLEGSTRASSIKSRMLLSIEEKVRGAPLSAIIKSPGPSITLSLASLPHPSSIAAPWTVPPKLTSLAPPQKNIQKERNELASILTASLLEWVQTTSLHRISADAIAAEKQQRVMRKGWLISRVADLAYRRMVSELINEQCSDIIEEGRMTVLASRYRTELISFLTRQMSENIIREVMKKECRSVARSFYKMHHGCGDDSTSTLFLDSGVSTPRAKTRKIHPMSAFTQSAIPFK